MEHHIATEGNVQSALNRLFGNNEKFGLVWIGPNSFLGFNETYIAHLRDSAHRTLLIITYLPGRPALRGYGEVDSVLQVTDASGQTSLTGNGTTKVNS